MTGTGARTPERDVVRRRLGAAVEEKATDAFSDAIVRSASPFAGAAETLTAAHLPHAATVIEFSLPVPSGAVGALAPQRGAAPDRATETGFPVTTTAAVRQAVVHERRAGAYAAMGSVYTEVERQAGSAFRAPSTLPAALPSATPLTQVCWLNGAVRTQAPPEVLAELAAAPEVGVLDVPVRLLADAVPVNLAAGGQPALAAAGLTGKGVVVGVIDSEVALGHPALAGRVVARRNYTAESWGFAGAHGTAVAGIIAADHAVHPGLAPQATVYSYKVLATIPCSTATTSTASSRSSRPWRTASTW